MRSRIAVATLVLCLVGTAAAAPDAWDPADDTPSGATFVTTSLVSEVGHGPHWLQPEQDPQDWFALDLSAGVRYAIHPVGSGFEPSTTIYRLGAGGAFELVAYGYGAEVRPTEAGRYYVRADFFGWTAPEGGFYDLRCTPVDALVVDVPSPQDGPVAGPAGDLSADAFRWLNAGLYTRVYRVDTEACATYTVSTGATGPYSLAVFDDADPSPLRCSPATCPDFLLQASPGPLSFQTRVASRTWIVFGSNAPISAWIDSISVRRAIPLRPLDVEQSVAVDLGPQDGDGLRPAFDLDLESGRTYYLWMSLRGTGLTQEDAQRLASQAKPFFELTRQGASQYAFARPGALDGEDGVFFDFTPTATDRYCLTLRADQTYYGGYPAGETRARGRTELRYGRAAPRFAVRSGVEVSARGPGFGTRQGSAWFVGFDSRKKIRLEVRSWSDSEVVARVHGLPSFDSGYHLYLRPPGASEPLVVRGLGYEARPALDDPTAVDARPGDVLTLTGRNFGAVASEMRAVCRVGSKAAPIVEWSDTKIRVGVPKLAPGQYRVRLTILSATYGAGEIRITAAPPPDGDEDGRFLARDGKSQSWLLLGGGAQSRIRFAADGTGEETVAGAPPNGAERTPFAWSVADGKLVLVWGTTTIDPAPASPPAARGTESLEYSFDADGKHLAFPSRLGRTYVRE